MAKGIGIFLIILIGTVIFLLYTTQKPQIAGGLTLGTGSAEIALTDAPISENISHVYVKIDEVSLHISDGEQNTKLDIQPFTVDLLAIQNIEQIVGMVELPAGHYTQIRLTVSEAKIVINGQEKVADIPSGKIKVIGQYEIKDKEETHILLDFDASKSVIINNKKIILKPFIKIKKIVENNKICKDNKGKMVDLEEADNLVETQSIGDTIQLVMNKVDKKRCIPDD